MEKSQSDAYIPEWKPAFTVLPSIFSANLKNFLGPMVSWSAISCSPVSGFEAAKPIIASLAGHARLSDHIGSLNASIFTKILFKNRPCISSRYLHKNMIGRWHLPPGLLHQ